MRRLGTAAWGSSWAHWITDWFFSAEIGLAKPNVDLYRYVTAMLKVPPANIIYLEDVQRGVDVAESLGWGTHLWSSQADAEELFRTAGLLAARVRP